MNVIKRFDPYTGTVLDYEEDRSQDSIFVSIVSYRDHNIQRTVESLFNNARRPENLMVSVALTAMLAREHWVEDFLKLKELFGDRLEIKVDNTNKNITIGSLRKEADSAYNKEKYYLSISSRSEFDPHWDDILIKQFKEIKNNFAGEELVFTAEPRGFLAHDDIVNGYVFYTNHKTKVSMQREEYDGCRVPISGYNDYIKDISVNSSSNSIGQKDENVLSIRRTLDSELFFQKFKFIKFNSRKFVNNEYIAIASGVSSKFIFAEAKWYLKTNPSNEDIIDNDQFEFYSFINLFEKEASIFSLRWTPVYYLYLENIMPSDEEKSPNEFYPEDSYLETKGYKLMYKLIQDKVLKSPRYDIVFGADWENFKFKKREAILKNHYINSINTFISMYNFSRYENSLHWNKRV